MIGVFGGSFDPPHRAHVLLVDQVLADGEVDQVYVVPVFEHAFEKDLAAFSDRLALCRLAFAHQPGVVVSAIEAGLPRPNFTLNTLKSLHEQLADQKLRLLIGADVLADAPRWHAWEEICRLAPPLVFGRQGVTGTSAPAPVLPAVSSTEVRRHLCTPSHPTSAEYLEAALPAAVLAEILRLGLYRDPRV